MQDRTRRGFATRPNCDACGRFHGQTKGASWAMRYSGWPPTPDREVFRCAPCTARLGPLEAQSGIRPEMAAGVVA